MFPAHISPATPTRICVPPHTYSVSTTCRLYLGLSSLFAVIMISLELWRARIGTFNNKRCSGRSLSSLSSSSLPSSHRCRRHTGSTNVSQEEPSIALASPSSSSLAIKEELQEFSTDHHSVLTTSSTLSCSSQCCDSGSFTASSLQSSSSFFPTSGTCSLHRSLLRDAVIALLIAVISQLLMIAGDIETNPGPKHGGENELVTRLRMNHIMLYVYKINLTQCNK